VNKNVSVIRPTCSKVLMCKYIHILYVIWVFAFYGPYNFSYALPNIHLHVLYLIYIYACTVWFPSVILPIYTDRIEKDGNEKYQPAVLVLFVFHLFVFFSSVTRRYGKVETRIRSRKTAHDCIKICTGKKINEL